MLAPASDTTHGTPSSRLTITAWLACAPISQITALAIMNSGTHDGSVVVHTRISPGSRESASARSRMTRVRAVTVPWEPGMPFISVPAGGRLALRRPTALGPLADRRDGPVTDDEVRRLELGEREPLGMP